MSHLPEWDNLDDAGLVLWSQNGHREAMEYLLDRHKRRVYNLARRLTDALTAEDITQQAFAVVFQDIEKLRASDSFGAWLDSITVNLCKGELRRRQHRAKVEVPLAEAAEDYMDDSLFESVAQRLHYELLMRELATLPETQRIPLVLRFLQGLSFQRISEVTGRPIATVKYRVYRGMDVLRLRLSATIDESVRVGRDHG